MDGKTTQNRGTATTQPSKQNLILQRLMSQNPMMANIVNLVNTQYGGDPRRAFYAEAQKAGVDPNQILNMLRNH